MAKFQLSTFSVDVTIPLGHTCMGLLPTPAKEILDPLYAHGFVLTGPDEPIVLCAVDWCEIRNLAYDRWREQLAEAVGVSRERVLVCSVHQHDAPVTDLAAENFLARARLSGAMFDFAFHEQTVQRVAAAAKECLSRAQPVTHLGLGQARVEKVASNRRVVDPDGRVSFSRNSSSGRTPFYRDADEGLIDPFLKTLSFWDGERPLLAVHSYATHPMSFYGRGGVSADFVGLARELRRRETPSVPQIYLSGCSGDVTAGKYNDGSPEMRPLLASRVQAAMKAAWEQTRKSLLETCEFRLAPLVLEFRPGEDYRAPALYQTLEDETQPRAKRILAAMALASRRRLEAGQPIDFPCLDFGPAQFVQFPGEAFVGYQLMAQQMRPDSFVMCAGYGECWPGYIPTDEAFRENFDDMWLWVAPGSEDRIRLALRRVLKPSRAT